MLQFLTIQDNYQMTVSSSAATASASASSAEPSPTDVIMDVVLPLFEKGRICTHMEDRIHAIEEILTLVLEDPRVHLALQHSSRFHDIMRRKCSEWGSDKDASEHIKMKTRAFMLKFCTTSSPTPKPVIHIEEDEASKDYILKHTDGRYTLSSYFED
jgi:hypothetical protein